MRNATVFDVQQLQQGGELPFNVMFCLHGVGALVHRKELYNQHIPNFHQFRLVETADGSQAIVVNPASELRAVPKKQGTPKKPKKPHVKGTRPFVYDPSLIKVGTRVKCRDKVVRSVRGVSTHTNRIILEQEFDHCLYLSNGKEFYINGDKSPLDIIAILPNIEQELPAVSIKGLPIGTSVEFRNGKTGIIVEHEAKGYCSGTTIVGAGAIKLVLWNTGEYLDDISSWDVVKILEQPVPMKHTNKYAEEGWLPWFGGECPCQGSRVKWRMRDTDNKTSYTADAKELRWQWENIESDIIAYKVMD